MSQVSVTNLRSKDPGCILRGIVWPQWVCSSCNKTMYPERTSHVIKEHVNKHMKLLEMEEKSSWNINIQRWTKVSLFTLWYRYYNFTIIKLLFII